MHWELSRPVYYPEKVGVDFRWSGSRFAGGSRGFERRCERVSIKDDDENQIVLSLVGISVQLYAEIKQNYLIFL